MMPAKPVIPYPAALQDAGVALSRMADGQSESLIIGNGDLYGIVWEKEGGLFLRITKNDIWDARVDTSKDGPLPKVNVRTRAVTGSTGAPPSYGNAFPQPLCAAALRIGDVARGPRGTWTCSMRLPPSLRATATKPRSGCWPTGMFSS